jgi:hypothetical protein
MTYLYIILFRASIRLDKSTNCQTTLHWAKAGCYAFESLGHSIRSIRLEQNFKAKDFVVALEKRHEFKSEWTFQEPDSEGKRVPDIRSQSNLQVLNGELFQDEDGNNCIQHLNSEIVRTYKNVYGDYRVDFQRCSGFAIGDTRLVMESPVVGAPGSKL